VFAGLEKEAFTFDRCRFYFLTDTKKYADFFLKNIQGERFQDWSQDFERYKSIADWAIDKVTGCEQIAIEGYSMGSKGKVFHIAENTGVLKYKIYSMGVPLEVIPPTTIKKYATGKGNSDKDQMHQSFMEETGVDLRWKITPDKTKIGNPVSDIVDSYFICKHLHDSIIDKMMDN
jgi:hypothetical protein